MPGHAKSGRYHKTQATPNEWSLRLNGQQNDARSDRLSRRANMRSTRSRQLNDLNLAHQLESVRLLKLTLAALGAVGEVVEINRGLAAQRARVQPNGKPSAGGSILPRASSSQELWGALDYQNL